MGRTLMIPGEARGEEPSPSPGPTSAVKQAPPSHRSAPSQAHSMLGPAPSLHGAAVPASDKRFVETGPRLCPRCGSRYPVEFNVCPRDASTLVDAPNDDGGDDLIHAVLADTYKIVRLVGEGGMGRVYEARHVRLGAKRFAIKVLHPEYSRHNEALSRFQREAETAASIDSPHVAGVYDVHTTGSGRPFIVAEFLDGKDLADHIKQTGKLDVGYAVRLALQIARALDAAHANGIVHRDMKPENVFLIGDIRAPTAKIIDFGISKIKNPGGANLTKTGVIMGTPAFMPPEQAKGEEVDARADVYSVGAILYNMLTGRRPFEKNDPTATITALLLDEPERPSVLNPAVPQGLELVIQKAMAKAAKDRFSSMKELEEALLPFDTTSAHKVLPANRSMRRTLGSIAGAGFSTQTMLAARQRDVELSRPLILLFGGLAGVGLFSALLTFVGAVIRATRLGSPKPDLTSTESLLLISMLALALATPVVFAVRHVQRVIWNNTAKTVEFSDTLRRAVTFGFVAYGAGILAVHLLEGVFLRNGAGVVWPVYDLLLLVAAVTAAAVGWKTAKR
ncbi:MAG: protein kinase [Polyangiaceae bacterium]